MEIIYNCYVQIGGCRYCFNISREHRGNHIYWVVDLSNRVAYQKCHDPDCRGFRSNDYPLPPFVVINPPPSPATDAEEYTVTDEELLRHLEECEETKPLDRLPPPPPSIDYEEYSVTDDELLQHIEQLEGKPSLLPPPPQLPTNFVDDDSVTDDELLQQLEQYERIYGPI